VKLKSVELFVEAARTNENLNEKASAIIIGESWHENPLTNHDRLGK